MNMNKCSNDRTKAFSINAISVFTVCNCVTRGLYILQFLTFIIFFIHAYCEANRWHYKPQTTQMDTM